MHTNVVAILLTIFVTGFAFGDNKIAHDRIPKLKLSLTEDGRIWIGAEEISIKQFSAFAVAVAEINPKTRLNLRVSNDASDAHIRKVVTAWAEAGLADVLFGSLRVDPRKTRR